MQKDEDASVREAAAFALGEIGPVPEGMVAWAVAAFVLVGTCVVIGKRLKA